MQKTNNVDPDLIGVDEYIASAPQEMQLLEILWLRQNIRGAANA